jgi:hypothetical protein
MKQCLIITATIKPNSVMVSQNDVELRREEYLTTLKYYIKHYNLPIYFIENSSFNFSNDTAFQLIFDSQAVELIKYPPSNEFKKGKGYQEFEMLDQTVVKLSELYDEFIKVSGRYVVTNFDDLKNQTNKGLVIDRHQKKKVAITSFFKCTMKEYCNYITGSYKGVNDSEGVFIEHIVYDRLSKINNNNIDLFIKNPVYKGVSGSYGGNLNRHPLKMKFRNAERKMLRLRGIKEFEIEY